MIRALMTLICFVVGGGMGFFLYCFGVAYLVEENLPNPEIAKGFVENFRMILLIGSLRIGELEEYLTPTLICLSFAFIMASIPFFWKRNKL
tara:strand:+ start:433 stop:705 length:273 start_codon:yes stop_codon:yes gene_type:complete